MTQEITTTQDAIGRRIEEVLVTGNLSVLTAIERVEYYSRLCDSLGINSLTKPFEYLTLNGKLVLYATKACAEQLRQVHKISISEPRIEYTDDLIIVTVTATDETGRQDSDMGVVSMARLSGENKANAMLKAVTKAKRRVTLSICGLGMLDETEVEDIPASAKRPPVAMPQARVVVDKVTGELPPVAAPAEQQGTERQSAPPDSGGVDFNAFWKEARMLGFDQKRVKEIAKTDSLSTWTQEDLDSLLMELRDIQASEPQGQLV